MTRILPVCVSILAIGLSIACWPNSGRASGDPAAALLSLINHYRAERGLTVLVPDTVLTRVAHTYAEDMVGRRFFAHTSPEGAGLESRLALANYNFAVAAENLARGYPDAASVFITWRNSPGHADNMTRDDIERSGIARVEGNDGVIWVLVVARPFG